MYSDQDQANHEYSEALQPAARLSQLEKPPSSSPITTNSMNNTAINDMNTALHDIRNGFHNTANVSTITCSSIVTSSNETGNDFHNTTSGMAINFTASSSGLLDSGGVVTAGFQGSTTAANAGSPRIITESSSACMDSADHAAVMKSSNCKRKRDWMNSLTQEDQTMDSNNMGSGNNYAKNGGPSKSNSSTSLLTSVKISNGLYSFPAGWEQYLDLQTGETYYVNWNTRTKHCRVQCPEVQRCLAGVQQQAHIMKATTTNKESVESWLSKMTATTSALVSNKPSSFVCKPPLPPASRPFNKSTNNKQPSPASLDLISIKRLINPCPSTTLLEPMNDIPSPPPSNFMPPAHLRDFTCFSPTNIDFMHSSGLLSPKPYYNHTATFESASTNLDVAASSSSTPIDPLAFVCSNCNKLVMISSLTAMNMQCPNCNHSINKWSDDITSSPCDMSLTALPLLEASTRATCRE